MLRLVSDAIARPGDDNKANFPEPDLWRSRRPNFRRGLKHVRFSGQTIAHPSAASPGSTNFDTATTFYDSDGRVSRTTMPCVQIDRRQLNRGTEDYIDSFLADCLFMQWIVTDSVLEMPPISTYKNIPKCHSRRAAVGDSAWCTVFGERSEGHDYGLLPCLALPAKSAWDAILP